jgi:predicted transcriptional regulator
VAEGQRRIDTRRLQALAAADERFLAAQALQHVRLEREQGQRCALAKGLAILDKVPKV